MAGPSLWSRVTRSGSSRRTHCGLPTDSATACTLSPAASSSIGRMSCGMPIAARNVNASPCCPCSSSIFSPAGVSIVTRDVPGRSRTISAARHRMPFPDTSDGLPSALYKRIRAVDNPRAKIITVGMSLHDRNTGWHQLHLAERQQMPAETLRDRSRQRVEQPDETRVVNRALQSGVQPRLDRKALRHDPDVRKVPEQIAEFADRVFLQHRRIDVLEIHLCHLRQSVEPRNAVVHLEHGRAARAKDAAAFANESAIVGCVLHDAMRVYQIEGAPSEWQRFPVRHDQMRRKLLDGE